MYKTKRHWFTLVEIVIVLMIIGIMMVAFKSIFKPRNQNTLYAQNCINIIYWEMNNFLNAAMTSKWLYTWNTTVIPDIYSISFNENTSRIDFKYKNKTQSGIQKTYILSGGVPANYSCSSKQYVVQMTGNNIRNININRWFSNQWDEIPFQIKKNTNTLLTWNIMFYACTLDLSLCQEIANISIDSRSKTIKKALCIVYTWTNNNQCLYRDK